MRHGARENLAEASRRLGCYYCNDIVAPADVCPHRRCRFSSDNTPHPVPHRPHTRSNVYSNPPRVGADRISHGCRTSCISSSASVGVRFHLFGSTPFIRVSWKLFIAFGHLHHPSVRTHSNNSKSIAKVACWESCHINCVGFSRSSGPWQ